MRGCVFHLRGGGREHLVADVDLTRVNERLAVEAHVAALQTFDAEAVEIPDVVEDAVDDVDAVGARGDHAAREPCGHGRAAGGEPRPRLLGEIVEAHDHDGEARRRVGGDRGDRAGVQNRRSASPSSPIGGSGRARRNSRSVRAAAMIAPARRPWAGEWRPGRRRRRRRDPLLPTAYAAR